MRKAAKIFLLYILGLFVCSFILSLLNLANANIYVLNGFQKLNLMLLITIIGGIWALKLTLPKRPLKIFLIIYFSLWIVRIVLLFFASKIGEVHLFSRMYRADLIITNYYATVSRLDTPMPFIIFWLINHFFTNQEQEKNAVDDTGLPQNS
jgi:hypothetical protein